MQGLWTDVLPLNGKMLLDKMEAVLHRKMPLLRIQLRHINPDVTGFQAHWLGICKGWLMSAHCMQKAVSLACARVFLGCLTMFDEIALFLAFN